jgi:acyl carrier protein
MTQTQQTQEKLERLVFDTLESFGAELAEISREAGLKELDIDSLDMVELGQIIEEEYGVRLTGADFKETRTVGEAIDVIAARVL